MKYLTLSKEIAAADASLNAQYQDAESLFRAIDYMAYRNSHLYDVQMPSAEVLEEISYYEGVARYSIDLDSLT